MDPQRWAKVKEIFEAAMDAAPDARLALVAQLAAGDAEMEKEALDLLAAASRAHDSFLVSPMDLGAMPNVFRSGEIIAGRYRIEAFLAAGGMGEVYAAEDQLLRARIALKTIHPAVVREESAQRRFRQEIQTARRVAHPNVCRVFDMGVHTSGVEPRLFLTMELLEGETLSELLKRSPQGLAWDDARPLIRAMCDALQAAHDAQVVHRDFKPANIFLTGGTGGTRLVVTDFGLARDSSEFGNENTHTAMTGGGLMGSPAYMAPELFHGARANTASDIYALGIVMYQLATGQRPFSADTPFAEALQKQQGAPPPSTHSPGLPKVWEQCIQRCLHPDPAQRPASARGVWESLQITAPVTPVPAAPAPRKFWWPIAAGAALALAAAGYFLKQAAPPATVSEAVPAPLALVRPLTNIPGEKYSPILSPDGTRLAFAWHGASGDNWDLYLTPVESEQYTRLTTSPLEDIEPAFSPDGQRIAFVRRPVDTNTNSERICVPESALMLVDAVPGGREQLVLKGRVRSVKWLNAQELIWSECETGGPRPIYSVHRGNLQGGNRRRITSPTDDKRGEPFFAVSPDGRSLALVRWLASPSSDVVLHSLDSGEERVLFRDPLPLHSMAWSPDGTELIFPSHLTGRAILSRLKVNGDGRPVPVNGVESGMGHAAVAPGPNGGSPRIVFDRNLENVDLWQYDLTGATPPRRVHSTKRRDQGGRFSPDGKHIVMSSDRYGVYDLLLADAATGEVKRLTENMTNSGSPAWSPNGQWIVFDSMVGGSKEMYIISAAGGKPRPLTHEPKEEEARGEFSLDGRHVYFRSNRGGGMREIWRIPFAGGPMTKITNGGGEECRLSADGKFLYITRKEPGIWRVPADGSGETTKFRPNGFFGYWDVNALGIYYLDLSVKKAPRPVMFYDFATNTERRVATVEKEVDRLAPGFAVSRDGHWLLVLAREKPESDLFLVENFR